MSPDPGFRPPLPLAKRLNRNALTVAAVLMGMTVLTAVVVLSPGRDHTTTPAGTNSTPAGPSRPTFLDEPAAGPALAMESLPVGPNISAVETASPPPGSAPRRPAAEFEARLGSPALGRMQTFEAALRSSVIVKGTADAGGLEVVPGDSDEALQRSSSAEERLLSLGDSLTRAAVTRAPAGSGPASRAHDFLERAGNAARANVVARLEPAGSPYTLRAGTVISGVLLTAINSDLPGEIVGQVSRNVYDSRTERVLLLPKGAKLIGTYDNQIAAGQGRLLVAWTRLILPDGRSMALPGLALKDPQGNTGAKDRVSRHYDRVFGNALLLSAISAGAQLSQPRQGSVLAAPSAGQVAAGALGQELSNVALEIIRRGIDVAPTITVRQGQPFLVFLNGDLVFDGPYEPEP